MECKMRVKISQAVMIKENIMNKMKNKIQI
jgi:hypothetical protein